MKTEIVEFREFEIYCPVDEKGQIYVAIKPICQALGIDPKGQRRRIQQDKILNQLGTIVSSTGRDSKQYEMYCLPLQFVFGWLFSIDENAVKPEACEQVLAYKMECHQVLYEHFVLKVNRYQARDRHILKIQDEIDTAEAQRTELTRQIKDKKETIRRLLGQDPAQLDIFEGKEVNVYVTG